MSELPCGALTKAGASCRAKPLPRRATCISHTPEMAETVRVARIKGGSAAAKVRMLQGRRLKLDTAGSLLKFNAGLLQDTLAGTVEPGVSRAVSYAIANQLRLVETGDLARRLTELETKQAHPSPTHTAWGRR